MSTPDTIFLIDDEASVRRGLGRLSVELDTLVYALELGLASERVN